MRLTLQCIAVGDLDLLQLLWIIEKPSEEGERLASAIENPAASSPLLSLASSPNI